MTLLVKKLTPTATLPLRATDGAAGFDLYAAENGTVCAYAQAWISTGLALSIAPDRCGLIWPRSGLAGKGITTDAGLIASDCRGEVRVLLVNRTAFAFGVSIGDRIAQLLLIPCYRDNIAEVDTLTQTARGASGFGSTGMGLIVVDSRGDN